MKYIAILFALIGIWTIQGSEPNTRRSIPVSVLFDTPVIGDFNLPVGTITRIRCHLVENPHAGAKSNKSMAPYQLAITAINQEQLGAPLMVDFKVSPQSRKSIPIHQSPFQFAQSKVAGTKAQPTIDVGRQMAAQWLGKRIHCLAYETGSFAGHPRYPKDLAPRNIAANQGFHFHKYVVLIDPEKW